jgi:dipeptidyl aminopeptidase/acylaminoacyl peptidase
MIRWLCRPCVAFALALALVPAAAPGQTAPPGPAFEAVISLRSIGSFALSQDGRAVAYEVNGTNWKENRYESEIWLARDGRPPFRLTRSPRGSHRPRWSPDGAWIAFLSDRGDKVQIHLIRPDGGEAIPLTAEKEGVNAFEWAPDGKRIAFTMAEPESDAMKQRKERYGDFAPEDEDYRVTHLWLVAVIPDSTPKPERLTQGDAFTVGGFAWSPDGTRIAFDHRPDPLITSGSRSDISVLDVASRAVTPLATAPGAEDGPVWSPDSQWIAYSWDGADTTSHYYRNGHLMKVAAAGGLPVELAADLDEWKSGVTWAGPGLYVMVWRGTERQVHLVDPNSRRTRPFATTPRNIWGIEFSADGKIAVLAASTPTMLTELYQTEVARWRPVPITGMTAQVAAWGLGVSEVVSWTSTDGTPIEGVLHKPRDFQPGRRYPLLVIVHGGPTGVDYPTPVTGGVYPLLQWLAKGALVLRPNYRGSAGYGEKFRSLNVRNLGVGDAWDVLSGVDHLIRQGLVDSTRMGAMGWSQGGYISAFLTTTTTRFRAISVGAGISDWMTYYVNTDIHPFTRQYLQGTPWSDPEIYAKTSPMTYITQARTPTLIQHGEFDRRVPIPNAYQLYQGLQDMGVPARLVVYKGFGHGINKPKERLAAIWHNWQWFAKWIWGEEVQVPVAAATEKP